jgi:hypothetical protein
MIERLNHFYLMLLSLRTKGIVKTARAMVNPKKACQTGWPSGIF